MAVRPVSRPEVQQKPGLCELPAVRSESRLDFSTPAAAPASGILRQPSAAAVNLATTGLLSKPAGAGSSGTSRASKAQRVRKIQMPQPQARFAPLPRRSDTSDATMATASEAMTSADVISEGIKELPQHRQVERSSGSDLPTGSKNLFQHHPSHAARPGRTEEPTDSETGVKSPSQNRHSQTGPQEEVAPASDLETAGPDTPQMQPPALEPVSNAGRRELSSGLAQIITAWPHLSSSIQNALLAIVNLAEAERCEQRR